MISLIYTYVVKAEALVARSKNLAVIIPILLLALCQGTVRADDFYWPTNQLLPTFSTPAANIDAIDVSSLSGPENDLFTSLQGIVNRTQPRLACPNTFQENNFTWLDLHGLPYTLINGYSAITKYRTNIIGLIVTDTNQPDTLNLATTIAGLTNGLICDPSLLAKLTNAPYNLPITTDLRGLFTNNLQVYNYLYTNYWPACTHRIIAGMAVVNQHGNFRDYIVAVKSATVWLNPAVSAEKTVLAKFLGDMKPLNGVYTGWWPSEADGLNWIYQYGIPVLASDALNNGSLFSFAHVINIPDIPLLPPLQNKVYVAMILSDGDNIQYMQHRMKYDWNNSDRGSVPIGWTVTPLAADIDPGMLNYFYSTATTNDCLISGPSGAGYTHMQKWSSANLAAFTKITDPYLRRSGLRVITVWDSVSTNISRSFATNCPTLLGLTDQTEGNTSTVHLGLRTMRLAAGYSSDTNAIYTRITNYSSAWNGTAPQFLAIQANVWDLGPSDLRRLAAMLDPNKFVLVRPDHLFLLYNSVYGPPSVVTRSASLASSSSNLRGVVTANSSNTLAWFEWGTNISYGSKSASFTLQNTNSQLSLPVVGFSTRTTYHYRLVASNTLGVVYGADKLLTVGNRVKAWGDGTLGQVAVPAGMTNAISLSCGLFHALALKNDGTVVVWGDNSFGQTNVPTGLSGVVEVAGGSYHSLALKSTGNIIAWGDNTYGKTNIPAGLTNAVAIAAGQDHNLALRADETVIAWGDNSYGQTNVPAGLTNVVAIAAGGQHSLALKADGTVIAWGRNDSAQTTIPTGLDHVISITAGQNFSLALKANGSSSSIPVPSTKWVADSLSGIDASQINSWSDSIAGRNATQSTASQRPQLYSNVINGHKVARFTSASRQYLTVVATNSSISSAGGFTMVMVLKTSTAGTVNSMFYNNTGLLGAEQSGATTDWALCLNGSQLGAGLGAANNGADFSLYGGSVTDGKAHIAIYHRAGDTISLYVDGIKVATQSSLNSAARNNYPFLIGGMTTGTTGFYNGDIAEIQIYDRALNSWDLMTVNEVLAATYGIGTGTAGAVVAWGNNTYGQTKTPSGLSNVTAMASGAAFNLALTGNDTLTGWGSNTKGQTSPTPGLTNIAAFAAGTNFALAIANLPPSVASTNISGYINHDLIVSLPFSNPDASQLSLRILSLPAAGALYQCTSTGVRGSLVNLANTVVSDPAGRLIFAPATGETNTPYATFTFMANDAFYSSGTGQISINIRLPGTAQFKDLNWSLQGTNGLVLTMVGSSNATYSLWTSTNLSDWNRIGAATEVAPGQYALSDTSVTNSPQRFYRLSTP